VPGNLTSPPRYDSLVLPRPSSSNFDPSWKKIKEKRTYSHVAIVEATTSSVSFDAQYLPMVEQINERSAKILK
jgi:hypothetical protein